ncbi:MAG: hypothetical protein IJ841_07595 [Prevotella sp.]|nr:hypothetical protein [Prevotella sp.]
MRSTLKFLLALGVAMLLMMAFRSLVFTIYTVGGEGLQPEFLPGDRVMVNRWSYGLRTGSREGLFSYGRVGRQPVERGDIVAFEDPRDSTGTRVLFARCRALPGDTLRHNGRVELVPSLNDCADADYYWVQTLNPHNPIDSRQLGFISEERIIGRVFLVAYSLMPDSSLLHAFRRDRFFLLK